MARSTKTKTKVQQQFPQLKKLTEQLFQYRLGNRVRKAQSVLQSTLLLSLKAKVDNIPEDIIELMQLCLQIRAMTYATPGALSWAKRTIENNT